MSSVLTALKSRPNPFDYIESIDEDGDSVLPPIPAGPTPIDRIQALKNDVEGYPSWSANFPNAHITADKTKLEKMLREFEILGKDDSIPQDFFEKEKERIKSLCFATKLRFVAHDKAAFVNLMRELGKIPKGANVSTRDHRKLYINMVRIAQKAHEKANKILIKNVSEKIKEAKKATDSKPITNPTSSSSSPSSSFSCSSPKISQESLASMRAQQWEAEKAGMAAGYEKLANKTCCAKCNKYRPISSKDSTLKKCSKCMKIYYCSTDCQRADWKRHKLECIPKES